MKQKSSFGAPKVQLETELTGIIRRVDSVGRIVIPVDYRRAYGFSDSVEILGTNDGILIKNSSHKK